MNKREAYEAGLEQGKNVASWLDLPQVGDKVDKSIDWVGYDTVTQDNLLDVCIMYANESESNGRQFSPFEFTAHEINTQMPEWRRDELWSEFDRGIEVGILKNLKPRVKMWLGVNDDIQRR